MVKKYKARQVALGYCQVSGLDVFNTFKPVVKRVTVRLLLAIALITNAGPILKWCRTAINIEKVMLKWQISPFKILKMIGENITNNF